MRKFRKDEESGFGIVEVLVAMTIMSLILMALAPFLISSFKAVARNIRVAGATQLVNERIEIVQSNQNSRNCASFNNYLANTSTAEVFKDEDRNITYRIAFTTTFDLDACNLAMSNKLPESYYYIVQVFDEQALAEDANAVPLAEGRTWIAVPGLTS